MRVKRGLAVALVLLGMFPLLDRPAAAAEQEVQLMLRVETDAAVAAEYASLAEAAKEALGGAGIGYHDLAAGDALVSVSIGDGADLQAAVSLLGDIEAGVAVTAGMDRALTLTLAEASVSEIRETAVARTLAVLERRLDEMAVAGRPPSGSGVVQGLVDEISDWLGNSKANIRRHGEDIIIIQLQIIEGVDGIGSIDFKSILGRRAELAFRLVDSDASIVDARAGHVPAESQLLWAMGTYHVGEEPELFVVRKQVLVGGANLIDAEVTFDYADRPAVMIRFDDGGARNFADATAANVGQRLAIVIDGEVISAPIIREPIRGGTGMISGAFTVQQAHDLALVLRAGALPVPVTFLSEQLVAP